jgi:hypothetical protein
MDAVFEGVDIGARAYADDVLVEPARYLVTFAT